MVRIDRATQLGTTLSAALTPSYSASERIFRKEGEYWTLVFQGVVSRVKETLGLHYLAYLLQHPHQDFPVLALVVQGVTVSESATSEQQDVPEPHTRAAYQRRLAELQAEQEEARAFNDLGRVEQVQEKLEVLTQELLSATGFGGHTKEASPSERARVNVTRAIKRTIRKITESHPALGQHLIYTIKTGTVCAYAPDPSLPSTWQV
jgi:hypothetical protein